jgi:hypothetical protein
LHFAARIRYQAFGQKLDQRLGVRNLQTIAIHPRIGLRFKSFEINGMSLAERSCALSRAKIHTATGLTDDTKFYE